MTCSNCGHTSGDGPGFCTVCGARLKWSGDSEAPNQPPKPPVPPPAPIPPAAPVPHVPPAPPVPPAPAMKACPFCAEQILQAAIKCRFCGSDLTASRRQQARVVYGPPPPAAAPQPIVIHNIQPPPPPVYVRYPLKNPGIAMLLSILFPGGGQFYNGDAGKGILILCTFWMFFPWIYGIIDAYIRANRINRLGF